jgi:hypothetical protein
LAKATGMMDPAKWQGPYCTLWGSLAPRSSTSLYQSDYAFANSGLKFKTMAHELFGVPRGREERWSLAYPWEGPGSTAGAEKQAAFFGDIKTDLDAGALKGAGVDLLPGGGRSRAEGLFRPGDPVMVDGSYTAKNLADQTQNITRELAYLATLGSMSVAARQRAVALYRSRNGPGRPGEAAAGAAAVAAEWTTAEVSRARLGEMNGVNYLPGERRIYTVWEKIECTSASKRLSMTAAGVTTRKYESCQAAFRFEVYKYIQLEVLRKACDWMGDQVGEPWR